MSELGEWAARRHQIDGVSWRDLISEAQEKFNDPEIDWHKVRDHGRAYINSHQEEYPNPGIELREQSENVATVYYHGPQIQTPAELLGYIGYNPDEWSVVERRVKSYQQTSKREDSQLSIDEGKITGEIDRGGIVVSTMFSISVKLVRRKPVAIEPAIQPIVVKAQARTYTGTEIKKGIKRELFLPDPHFGFYRRLRDAKLEPMHDRLALDLALQIGIAAKVDGVTWGGDDLDSAEWSTRFTKSPEFYWTTQPALLESHLWKYWFVDALPGARHRVLGGNHDEQRLETALLNHLPAAYGLQSAGNYKLDGEHLLSLPHLLGLEQLGIEYIGGYPDAVVWLNNLVGLEHGENSKLTAGDYVTVCGHYHRREWVSKTRWGAKGAEIGEAFCPGLLGQIDKLPGRTNRQNWQQGFAIIDYDPRGTTYQIIPVIIDGGKAIWNGHLYTGKSRLKDIKHTYHGWNW